MRLFIAIMVVLMVFSGCESINKIISPEMQCSLLKNGARIGIGIAADKYADAAAKEHAAHVAIIMEKQILPKFRGEGAQILTRADLDWCLDLLNKELTNNEKIALQGGIDLIIAWTPNFPEAGAESVGGQIVKNIICLLEGLLDGLVGVSDAGTKVTAATATPEKIILRWGD